jgi:hypothetical protein
VTATPQSGVPAALPLTLLESMRALDAPRRDALDEHHTELTAKRLGLNRTVEAEIARLARLAGRGGRVPGQEFAALQRLVARRPDASLVFTDAGRRAARRAWAGTGVPLRFVMRTLPRRLRVALGARVARRLAAAAFGSDLHHRSGVATATLGGGIAVVTEAGPACSFVGAGIAELLRVLTGFDGAMVHVRCRARGADSCAWSATSLHSQSEGVEDGSARARRS